MPDKSTDRLPDMLRFIGGTVKRYEVGWVGSWPPPEMLRIAHGKESGIIKVLPEDFDLSEFDAAPSIIVTTYRRQSASILPESRRSSRIFRGAEYVPT